MRKPGDLLGAGIDPPHGTAAAKELACFKPLNKTVLEHTISYEQLAVDLTAHLHKVASMLEQYEGKHWQ